MTDIVIEYKEFVIPIFTALIMGIGFLLKEVFQRKKNKKTALFLLLEVWHRYSIILLKNSQSNLKDLLRDFYEKHNVSFDESKNEQTINQFNNIAIKSAELSQNNEAIEYEKKFKQAITLIASEDPIFAYQINTIDNLKNLTSYKNRYEELVSKEIDETIINDLIYKELIEEFEDTQKINSLENLEINIKSLALKVGLITYFKTIREINFRKKQLEKSDIDNINENELFEQIMSRYMNKIRSNFKQIENKLEQELQNQDSLLNNK